MKPSTLKTRTAMLTLALLGYSLPIFAQSNTPAPYAVTDVAELLDFEVYFEDPENPNDNDYVFGIANDLNDQGKIVGEKLGSAFVFQNGLMTYLPVLDENRWIGQSRAISPNGKITGDSFIGDGTHAFIYDGGQTTDIDTTHVISMGYGINDAGQVAGEYQIPSEEALGVQHAFIYRDNQRIDIPFPVEAPNEEGIPTSFPPSVTDSSSSGINSSGQVVGNAYSPEWGLLPFVSDGTTTSYLATPNGESYAYAINNAGHIVGYNASQATLWTNDGNTVTHLETLGSDYIYSYANDINDNEQIVGEARTAGHTSRAVFWQNGHITDLNTLIPANSGWVLLDATKINNRGEILGNGMHNGHRRQFVLTLRASDNIAPTSTAIFDGRLSTEGNSDWYVDTGHLVLSAKDFGGTESVAGTGLDKIYYRINGGPVQTYTEPVLFEDSGIFNVSYWSVDVLGHVEPSKSIEIKLDNVLPVVNASRVLQVPAANKALVVLHGKMTDAHSGIFRPFAKYTISDEYEQYQPEGSINVRPNGTFDLALTLPAKLKPNDNNGRCFQVTITGYDFAGNSNSTVVNLTTGKKDSSNSS